MVGTKYDTESDWRKPPKAVAVETVRLRLVPELARRLLYEQESEPLDTQAAGAVERKVPQQLAAVMQEPPRQSEREG
jgi:hypothetical protein